MATFLPPVSVRLRATALGLAFGLIGATGSAWAADPRPSAPATLYSGGDILTMVGPKPIYAEALVEKSGKILYVGPLAGAIKAAGPATRRINLAGHTLLPGFIDAHGHMVYYGKNQMDADLFGVKDIPELVARLRAHAASVPSGAWIVGFGYQAKAMREGRTPTALELDGVSPDRPVMIVDSSGHLGSANNALLKRAGVTASTADPTGGAFARQSGSREPLGPMEETALNAVRSQRPAFTGKLADDAILAGAAAWARFGQTTAQDCGIGLGADDIAVVRNAIDKKLLLIDLYICAKDSATNDVIDAAYGVSQSYTPSSTGTAAQLLAARPDLDRRYINRVRLGAVKYWLDGSVDTAWFTQPYTTNPPGKSGEYRGYEQIPDAVLLAGVERFWNTGIQINMHMNGDAAADQALRVIEAVIKKKGWSDHRPVFIHATYLRPDQIQRMKAIGAVPSFLVASIASAGDAVERLWGPDRAAHAAAAHSFQSASLPYTLSHDAPVSPSPTILGLVDAAVNRRTASGRVIGPAERISPYDALRAVTVMAAYQIKEEKSKGSLEPGKLADLVIIERNPLKVEPGSIGTIRVVETIKEGQPVYRMPAVELVSISAAPAMRPQAPHNHGDALAPPKPMPASDRATMGRLVRASQASLR